MTLTLLPAVLGLLGDRINRGKLPVHRLPTRRRRLDQRRPLRLLGLDIARRDAPPARQPARVGRPAARAGQLHLLAAPGLRRT